MSGILGLAAMALASGLTAPRAAALNVDPFALVEPIIIKVMAYTQDFSKGIILLYANGVPH
jgi:hypothetical protein